jgi:hypothetical protein
VSKSANNLAARRWELGDYEGADSAYNEALIAATELNDGKAIVKQRANLALLWFTQAAGALGDETDPEKVAVDRTTVAWKKARAHLAKAVEQGQKTGQGPKEICAHWGRYDRLCPLLL